MDFPHEFSARARAHVEAERLRANLKLAQSQSQKPPDEWTRTAREWDRSEFHCYILRIFLAFAREAFKLGKQEVWTVDRIRSEAEEFLRKFTIEAYYEKGRDRFGQKFPEMTGWRGGLLPEVEQAFHKTHEWDQFEMEFLAVAEQIANPPNVPAQATHFESSVEQLKTANAGGLKLSPVGAETNSESVPDLETPEGRKRAREEWKHHWTTEDHVCTNDDLTETAFNQKDSPFLNQWENGTMRLKDPGRSTRVQAIERVLRENEPPKWHPMAKQTRS